MSSFLQRTIDESSRRVQGYRDAVAGAMQTGNANPLIASIGGLHGSLDHGSQIAEHSEQYKHYVGWPYVAISRVATRIAGQAVHLGRRRVADANDRGLTASKLARMQAVGKVPSHVKAPQDGKIELVESHELLDAIGRPNPFMVAWSLFHQTVASVLMAGKSYWWFVEGNDSLQIYPLPANWVTPVHSKTELFTKFKIQPHGWSASPIDVSPEQIAFFSLPDPSDPFGTVSPLQSQSPAVATDEQIQVAQHRSFKNGLFPNLALRVGRLPGMLPGQAGERPVLEPDQRVELINAVRQLYEGAVNYNEPLIIDGMIEGIDKLSTSIQEMDFLKSGEAVKSRIMQSFGVNPIIAGEITNVNRAQAAVAERMFCTQVANPLITLIGQVMTRWLAQQCDPELVFWIEPCRADDAELKLKEWDAAMKHGAATRNEYRTEILGVDAKDEPGWDEPPPPSGGGMMAGGVVAAKTRSMGRGCKESETGSWRAARGRERGVSGQSPLRRYVGTLWTRQLDESEAHMVRAMGEFFRGVFQAVDRELDRVRGESPQLFDAPSAAGQIADQLFRPRDWDAPLRKAALRSLARAAAAGYLAEKAIQERQWRRTELPNLTPDELAVIAFEVPPDVAQRVEDTLAEQMKQPYWDKVNDTTRDRLESTLKTGMAEGWSGGKLAKQIRAVIGDTEKVRSRNIARTEVSEALNAGHLIQTNEMQAIGIAVAKVWTTVGDADVRVEHAVMEGASADGADGLFNVDGYEVPYPGHFSLPAGLRCNCRCGFYTVVKEGIELPAKPGRG